ncbi:LIM domain-containing protein [Centropristis striata]|uniref:LIM domain-containing protein n=1 Tax=Centropristis striata TaxID=184440 RepID=UPI0027DF5875|nr:LIM domain-containing protein [Centropristis striata]
MSALYLSKVVPQDSTHSLLKPAQGQSSEIGKRVKLTKMAEDSQERTDDLPPPPSARNQPRAEVISGAHLPQSMPAQPSKEKLYQQRQKCELRRLLKHTHPELKMLDEVVDEELAEVLGSETEVTADETGYEGEVLSRRLIFENCAQSNKVSPYIPKINKAEGTVGRGNVGKTSAVFEEHEGKPCKESDKAIMQDDKELECSPDLNRECDEEVLRIDVRATRRIFESQSVNTSTPNPDKKFQEKVSISGDETGAVQKQKQEIHSENKSKASTKSLDLMNQPKKQGPCVHTIGQNTEQDLFDREEVSTDDAVFEGELSSLSDPEELGEIIKTSAALFQNNPFIPTNIEKELSFVHTSQSQSSAGDIGVAQDYPVDNVKNRAHLFESMPFDKIRQQNKDEIETMVENIKETLNSLYRVNAIHSDGSIIEVNETMIAKRAKFILSESGPQINYNEVAEGGAQNFIVHLLPRANLKSKITYLKESSKGSVEATVVNVPMHQAVNVPMHQQPFTTNQDFKTANVVQLVEDILNQDNSLRKGVIIQEDADKCAEVLVYSLYNYFDEEDVKSYSPPQDIECEYEPWQEGHEVRKTDTQELRKGVIESTISSLLETPKDQTCQGSIRPEIMEKGNVKLFKSCIEKGDLEYLKTLQVEPTVQEEELPSNQNVAGQGIELHHEQAMDPAAESISEWIPVDVKRLKNMFSGDQIPALPKHHVCESSQASTECIHGQVKDSFRECSGKTQEEVCNSTVAPQGSYRHLKTQDDGSLHQAELVQVVNDNDEISNLQTAIHSLQQATIEAKSLHQSSQEKQKFVIQEPVAAAPAGQVQHSKTEAELPQDNENQKEDPWMEPTWDEHKKDTETVQKQHFQAALVSETTAAQQEDEEVVFEGKLQAALDALGRSNINVSRGDFRAAMIYRNASKPHKERSQKVDTMSSQKPPEEEFDPVTKPETTQAPLKQEVSKEQIIAANAEPVNQSETPNKPVTSAVSEKSRSPVGPKPAIPPKPEHLKVKQRDIQSTNTKAPEVTQSVTPEETCLKPLPVVANKGTNKQGLVKINTASDSISESVDHQRNKLFDEAIQMSQETEVRHQVQGSAALLESDNTDMNIIKQQQEIKATAEEKSPQDLPIKENMNETDESHVDFHEACKKFGGKKVVSAKNAPVKPKRVKIAQPDNKTPKHMSGDNSLNLTHVVEKPQQPLTGPLCINPNTCGRTTDSKDKHEKEMKPESKVEMREKKGRTETEDERRQRLSVHMDEIMRGNITTAMEIFDNLRKQEELQSILTRVEEIEEDTSEVDVRSLRQVFENVPDWVVSSEKKKQNKAKVENKEVKLPLRTDNTESKSSMAHVFGDLERASEEIMNLKEQTLARLVDIEEAIKKALFSVSTLKSDSDIAGLSCLFKESLGTTQESPSSGSVRKISIGSSKIKSTQTQKSPMSQGNTAARTEVGPTKQRASPPSSPAFISIQSAARKTDKTEVLPAETTICPTCQQSPKTEEKFRTTKTLTCNSPAQNRKRDPRKGGNKQSSGNPKREVSVFEVQTDHEGNSIMGTKTVKENYERTDTFGNRFYSSKTSTVVTSAQPETTTTTSQAVVSPASHQVTKYPEVRLPINQKP